jgi:RHS repeat-associated protein
VANHLDLGLRATHWNVGVRLSRLIGTIGLVFFFIAYGPPNARANWGGGGVPEHATVQAQCNAIASSFGPTAFVDKITPNYASGGGSFYLWSYQCDIINGVSGPVVPVDCPTGEFLNPGMPNGCSPAQGINDGKGLGACGDVPGSCSAGNPIMVGSGNKFEAVTDYATSGQNPLAFIRYYNGFSHWLAPTATLGSNWRSNYERYLTILTNPSGAVAERADGQVVMFNVSNGVGTPDSDVDLALVQSGNDWVLTNQDDTVETYGPPNSIGRSQLLTIQARNGYTQTLSYNSSNQLAAVTDSYNRTLNLAYANGLLSTVTTPDGLVLTYGFSASGQSGGNDQLASVSYSTSPVTSQTYVYENASFPFALTGIIDEDGNRFATWAYDQYGRATSSQHAGGADLTTLSYNVDSNGNPTSTTTTNALGQQMVNKLSVLQTVAKLTEIDRLATSTTAAATRLFTYDTNGYVASQTDWNGNLTNYVNDSRGEPTSVTEAVGTPQQRVTTTTYLSNFHLPSQIVGPLTTANFTYDASGDLLTQAVTDTTTFTVPYPTNGITRTWTYTWANSLLASAQGPRGSPNELLQYGYDSSGALTSTTNGLSQVTHITLHLPGGLPETILDPNNVTTQFTYDARQRLLTSTIQETSGPLTTTYAYDAVGNLTKRTLPDGSALTYTYDAAHRLVGVADRFFDSLVYTLDAFGDRTQITTLGLEGMTRTRQATFDALGRRLTEIGGAGQTTSYIYDNVGNITAIADPLTYVTNQTFDALNRLISTTQPNSAVTTLQYDPGDKINNITDPNNNQTSYVNDGFGDRIQEVSPDRGTTVYHYDLGANLTQRVNGAGTIANQTYDPLDRIATTSYPGGSSENVAYTYDQGTNGIGHLTSLTDAVGSLTLSYDRRGLVTLSSRTDGSAVLTTGYAYDPASRLGSITYPSGLVVTYVRDGMGKVVSVGAVNPNIGLNTQAVFGIVYEPFGPPSSLAYGNRVFEARAYDLDYRQTSLASSLNSQLQYLNYGYDADDNILSITDSVIPANTQGLGYDIVNRLLSATGSYGALQYTYDPGGNRQSQVIGGTTQSYAYTAGSNRLLAVTQGGTTLHQFGYSPTGNVIQDNRAGTIFNFSYGQADRLASVQQASTPVASYTYDAFGQRLLKSLPGTPATTTLYQYDLAGHLIEDSNISTGSPSPQADYIYLGDQPVGLILGGVLYYYHDDHLGTPQLVTGNQSAIQWTGTYQPFGPLTINASITQNIRLPGQYADAETGWSNNGFRTYAQDLGRYIQSDPIGLEGGLNTYAYVEGNPLKLADPTGTDAVIPAPPSGGPNGPPGSSSKKCLLENCPNTAYLLVLQVKICLYECPFSGQRFQREIPASLTCRPYLEAP